MIPKRATSHENAADSPWIGSQIAPSGSHFCPKSSKSCPKKRFRTFTNHKNRAKSVQSILFCAFRCGLALSGSEKRPALQGLLEALWHCFGRRVGGGGTRWRQVSAGSCRVAPDRPRIGSQEEARGAKRKPKHAPLVPKWRAKTSQRGSPKEPKWSQWGHNRSHKRAKRDGCSFSYSKTNAFGRKSWVRGFHFRDPR